MIKIIRDAGCATLAVAVFAGGMLNAAVAQDAGVAAGGGDDYTPRGARVGSFMFYPKLEVTESYNDNLYAADTAAKSDWVTDVKPSFNLNSDWNNHAFNLKANSDVRRHKSYSDENVEEYSIAADGRIDVRKATKVTLGAGEDWKTEERSSPDDTAGKNPTEYTVQNINAGIETKPNRVSVALNGTFDKSNYDDTTGATGTVTNNDDRDRRKLEGTLKVGYEIVPEYEAFVKVSYNDINYASAVDDNGFNRDSDGYKALVGAAIDLSKVLNGDVAVGYMSQDYKDANLLDPSGWSAEASLTWTPTQLTDVKLTASRSVDESTTNNVSSLVNTSYGVTVSHELKRNISLGARAQMSSNDQQGASVSDDTLTLGANVDYKLNRNLYAGADYQRKDKNSTTNTSDYIENIFKVKLGAQF